MLLERNGIIIPPGSHPVIADSDLSHRTPRLLKELRADNVFLFRGMTETIAVVVEVQTTPPDPKRLLAWPCDVTSARVSQALEELMATHFKSTFIESFIEKGIEKGIGQGEERALLAVLAARGFTIRKQVQALISACADPDQLEIWISRAVTAATIDGIFA
jgi:hypothetical protein